MDPSDFVPADPARTGAVRTIPLISGGLDSLGFLSRQVKKS